MQNNQPNDCTLYCANHNENKETQTVSRYTTQSKIECLLILPIYSDYVMQKFAFC